jgi:hypothetical protein
MLETAKLLERVKVHENDGVHKTHIVIDKTVVLNHVEIPRLLMLLQRLVYGCK